MAIKERKQVSGTTPQIKAYAGHEGQLVWDKDKKTFVGMSGTAGTNYPLATQEYADDKVSHLEGKVDTSNATITEALNKKENLGVCLPLTGGTLSGNLKYSSQLEEFSIECTDRGAGISLNSANRENFEGQVILKARTDTEDTFCNLFPNGEFKVNGNNIEYIVQKSDGCIRYASGLQIAWLAITITTSKNAVSHWYITYPLPFIAKKNVIPVITVLGNWAYSINTNIETTELTGCGGTIKRTEGEDTSTNVVYGIIIGSWK